MCGNVRYEVQGNSEASVSTAAPAADSAVLISFIDSMPLCRLSQDWRQHLLQQCRLF